MTRYAALLRGVNLGPKNKVPMVELRQVLDSLGYRNVSTYIQSGNIIFDAAAVDETKTASEIQSAIRQHFDVDAPVILRSREEMRAIAASNPFDTSSIEPVKLHVMLLDRSPDPADVARLDPERSAGDRFLVQNREIYIHFSNGAARSKLGVDYFDRMLSVTATARNWNTINKLVELLDAQ